MVPRMRGFLALVAPAVTVLAGCAAALLPGTLGERHYASIEVRPDFRPARSVQAVVTPYSSADVEHLVVKVFTVSGDTETQATGSSGVVEADVAFADLGTPLILDGLHSSTSYRVRGYAYTKPGTDSADLISITDKSYVDITVSNDDRPSVGTLPVQLIGRTFTGAGTGSLEIKQGRLEGDGTESIEVGIPQ